MIRDVRVSDAPNMLQLMLQLDQQTRFMLFEPGERNSSLQQQTQRLQAVVDSSSEIVLVAEDNTGNQPVLTGFIAGRGGQCNRNHHCLYLVMGVLQQFSGQGLGSALLKQLEQRALQQGFHRLELTVMAHNDVARRLYLKQGFEQEGIKRHSLRVDGQWVDELYMAKLLQDDR